MGLLSKGTPMHWDEAKKHANHVRKHGISQLINIYKRQKDRRDDPLLWGDEIEYVLVHFDKDQKNAALNLRASVILDQLIEAELQPGYGSVGSWKPEYARYMLEGTPLRPYESSLESLREVELNMKERRAQVEQLLSDRDKDSLLSITNFPSLGVPKCFYTGEQNAVFTYEAAQSHFIPDQAIAPHARFPTLTRNIRLRRGSKVAINVPIMHDTNTPTPFQEGFHDSQSAQYCPDAKVDHIYMDCMCFGMGCSCLQLTFQSANVTEARDMYDQLAVLAPIMLALTAGSPIYRGHLVDVDCRWNIISASVDDRTPFERGAVIGDQGAEVGGSVQRRIMKSRYDSVSTYLSQSQHLTPQLNDIPFVYDEQFMDRLKLEGGLDDVLAKHYAHLFIRDPLVIFSELLDQNDDTSADHFENIQSTNWQTVRFKPPPLNSNIGWRVEFRSMEIHITEFENAAFACFMNLVYRTILHFQLNLYIPLSKVDFNMQLAQKRDAVKLQKFYFRPLIVSHANGFANGVHIGNGNSGQEWRMMSINEIMNGSEGNVGLIPMVRKYLESQRISQELSQTLESYLSLISKRASGELKTTAAWMRQFVMEHPDYKHDSVVSSLINYDLCVAIRDITSGTLVPKDLLPSIK
ncbi:hypothetical protein MIR68_008972 [Amoeboaphelidium protococcarum]|nr:hypothetical protein MIR68_008972 [Amoeboaphelidium protococcarum]